MLIMEIRRYLKSLDLYLLSLRSVYVNVKFPNSISWGREGNKFHEVDVAGCPFELSCATHNGQLSGGCSDNSHHLKRGACKSDSSTKYDTLIVVYKICCVKIHFAWELRIQD